MIIIRKVVNFDEYGDMPNSDSSMIVILMLLVVILPLKFVPIKFARLLDQLSNDWILNQSHHTNGHNGIGYNVPGVNKALFMFLPSATKKLYQLRFECHLFCKIVMHTFYLASTVIMINLFHITMEQSTLLASCYWLQFVTTNSYNTKENSHDFFHLFLSKI